MCRQQQPASLNPNIETRDGQGWIAEVQRRAHAAINRMPGLTWNDVRKSVEERIAINRAQSAPR